MPLPLHPSPPREPRTFELRDAEWIEHAATARRGAPFWLMVPVVLATLTGFVLVAFAGLAALATGGLVALRRRVLGFLGR